MMIRSRRTKPRRGPLRDPGYLKFLRTECRCVACKCAKRQLERIGFSERNGYNIRPADPLLQSIIDPMHGPTNGMRSKGPDREAIPGCRIHHEEQTKIGWPAFEERYEFSREFEAAAHYKLYQIWRETTGVID